MAVVPGPIDVVLVDDAADVRAVVAQQLLRSGHFRVVGEGATGDDAVDLARRHHPTLMVLDVSMPGTDGLQALPAVLAASPTTKVVLFTGFEGPALQRAARALGAADVVEKGSAVRSLAERLLAVVSAPAAATGPAPARPDGSPPAASGAPADAGAAEAAGEAAADGAGPLATLAAHLERFRTVFDDGTIGMATMTLTGTIVRANAALAGLLGRDDASLTGTGYPDLAPPGPATSLREAVAQVAGGSQAVVAREHPVVGDGALWLRSTVAAVRDGAGRPLYLFAQADDITPARRASAALRASEERFRLLVEGVRDYAIFMLDPEGHVSTWNLGAERLKGYRADEILGRHFRVFYEADAQAARHPERELELAIRHGRYEEEGWRVRQDGSRFWAHVLITALFDNGRLAGFAKVTRDVTDQRAVTEARQRASDKLEEANRRLREASELTAQFVAMTVHELRSPVVAMIGSADILQAYWAEMDDSERKESLDNILRGGARLRRMLEDLLLTSRLEAGSFELSAEHVPVADAITEALADCPDTGGAIEVVSPPDLVVWADRTRLHQIMANLLTNAAKYGKPPIRVVAAASGQRAEVRVHDKGEAIDAEAAARLFDKFVQGPGGHGGGTGLGLFVVRELARGHGGDAWYETDAEGCSCFCFSLPLA